MPWPGSLQGLRPWERPAGTVPAAVERRERESEGEASRGKVGHMRHRCSRQNAARHGCACQMCNALCSCMAAWRCAPLGDRCDPVQVLKVCCGLRRKQLGAGYVCTWTGRDCESSWFQRACVLAWGSWVFCLSVSVCPAASHHDSGACLKALLSVRLLRRLQAKRTCIVTKRM